MGANFEINYGISHVQAVQVNYVYNGRPINSYT